MKSKLLLFLLTAIVCGLLIKTATSYTSATLHNSTSIQLTDSKHALISIHSGEVLELDPGKETTYELEITNNISNSLSLLEETITNNELVIEVTAQPLKLGRNTITLTAKASGDSKNGNQTLKLPLFFEWNKGSSEISTELKIMVGQSL
ncbi:hypothetical protein [Bacillus tianshenii]|uniref:hypothetical protein n=1 Tax=Sutcliffiella tianshenii TaxID=1463404 RepID=UPI00195A9EAF|nr:hypothetical protein [Bacillus tianshenii]